MSDQGAEHDDQHQQRAEHAAHHADAPKRRARSDSNRSQPAARRDADAARAAAAERVAKAQRVASSVEAYHEAADRIDAATEELARAGEARLAAIRDLRDAGLTITEIAELTSLSASRIQALTKEAG